MGLHAHSFLIFHEGPSFKPLLRNIAIAKVSSDSTLLRLSFFLISYFQRLNDELNIAMAKLIKVVFKDAGGVSCVYLSLN